mgnify:FL=1
MATITRITTPTQYYATYRGIPVTARLLAGGYSITGAGYAGTRLVAFSDPELVLAGRLDVQPTDTRPLWQSVCDHDGSKNNGRY